MGSRVGAGTYLLSMSAVVNLWCLAVIVLYRHVIVPGIASRTDIEYGLGVLGVGKPPPPSSGLKTIAALVSFGVALVLVPYVARLYAGMHLHSAF